MKKLTFILFALITYNAISQIELVQEFTDRYIYSTQTEPKMFYAVDTNLTYYIYDENFNLYKTISFPQYNGNNGSCFYITNKLFNDDEQLEFIVWYAEDNHFVVYDENLDTILTDVGTASPAILNGNAYLVCNTSIGNYSSKIYSLPGTFSWTNLEQTNTTIEAIPMYSNNMIKMPYAMASEAIIYNMSGMIVETKQLDANTGIFELKQNDLSPGTYICKIGQQVYKINIK